KLGATKAPPTGATANVLRNDLRFIHPPPHKRPTVLQRRRLSKRFVGAGRFFAGKAGVISRCEQGPGRLLRGTGRRPPRTIRVPVAKWLRGRRLPSKTRRAPQE